MTDLKLHTQHARSAINFDGTVACYHEIRGPKAFRGFFLKEANDIHQRGQLYVTRTIPQGAVVSQTYERKTWTIDAVKFGSQLAKVLIPGDEQAHLCLIEEAITETEELPQ